MAYTLPFLKVNVEGHFGGSSTNIVERWQAGLHVIKNGGVIGGTSELTAFLTAIRAPILTYHGTTAVASGTSCFVSAVSGAYIGTDGNYALGALQTTTRVPMTTVTAGTGGANSPFTQACVISLRSLLTRGPGSHGRIYWPRTGLTVDPGTGTISSGNLTNIANAAKAMLDGIGAAAVSNFGSGSYVGLVSPQGTGFQSPVIRVGIGQKLDHMESREKDIPEGHVFATLAGTTTLLEDLDDEFRRRMEELQDTPSP
jgi:hypothetical protein